MVPWLVNDRGPCPQPYSAAREGVGGGAVQLGKQKFGQCGQWVLWLQELGVRLAHEATGES